MKVNDEATSQGKRKSQLDALRDLERRVRRCRRLSNRVAAKIPPKTHAQFRRRTRTAGHGATTVQPVLLKHVSRLGPGRRCGQRRSRRDAYHGELPEDDVAGGSLFLPRRRERFVRCAVGPGDDPWIACIAASWKRDTDQVPAERRALAREQEMDAASPQTTFTSSSRLAPMPAVDFIQSRQRACERPADEKQTGLPS